MPVRSPHLPVLLEQAVAGLAIRPDGVYVDGTFGRGGHSRRILAELGPTGRLVAIDRDPEAAREAAAITDGRFRFVASRFSALGEVLDALGIERIDGLLLDLGVSSPQFDRPERGFSFRSTGPLDMRMDPRTGVSAREWLLDASESEIADVLRRYGDERAALPIAKAIVARRRDAGAAALQTTTELAGLVAGVLGRRGATRSTLGKNPATRTFQALRILVNQELAELEGVLRTAVERLAIGGRLVVIGFNSIEDRLVKRFMAEEAGRNAPRDPVRGDVLPGHAPRLRVVGRVLPDESERERNPRARSAVLRVAQRVQD
ncbi:MAG: 16S rRNA (cytosine(1402)-N(4))-methyltransferase RsmH [Burkholderiaceae bacterium]|nr:16S rRNA (cytosine(1402)-N(4))-methyltransferase RsmH [Burkholderiaceae bacterium]MEB2320637.1 16S rRNA (cytosine(1402)-N(4))-methyltransferase RsmH [Pseudomonadota bacterium]